MAVKSSTNPDAVIFDYFGYTYEIIDENKKEVALIGAADAPERCVIPKMVEYKGEKYSVTAIGTDEGYVFTPSTIHFNETITEIELPSTLKTIGRYAFWGCLRLTTIIIPERVSSMGSCSFRDCKSLTTVILPKELISIEYETFCNCYDLTSITIPKGVTSIDGSAFIFCKNLATITIPEGVTSIGNDAFYGCENLTSITIPEGVTSIGDGAFYRCKNLISITIPEGVTSIGDRTFRECLNLATVIIPKGVTSIGYEAFAGCENLTTITIPEGVTSIGSSAFNSCPIRHIVIPSSVESIGPYAFKGEEDIQVDIYNEESAVVIASNAFSSCAKINYLGKKKAQQPVLELEDIEDEDDEEWVDCEDIDYQGVNYSACEGSATANFIIDEDIRILRIPDKIKDEDGNEYVVDEFEIEDLYKVEHLHLPKTLKRVYGCALERNRKVNVRFLGLETPSVCFENGIFYSQDKKAIQNTKLADIGSEYTVKEGVEVIEIDAFENCKQLRVLNLPSTIKTINPAFNGCSALQVVNIYADSINVVFSNLNRDDEEVDVLPDNVQVNYLKPITKAKAPTVQKKTEKQKEETINTRRFALSSADKKIFGVCGGIANYFDINSSIVRIAVVILSLIFPVFFILVYFLLKLIMPNKDVMQEIVTDETKTNVTKDYSKYSINGEGSYGKARMVEAVVNKYIELNPNITIDKLKRIFSNYLQGTVLIEDSAKNIKDMKRFYESSLPNGTKFYISNQWGTQTDGFVEYVNNNIEGITVTKLKNAPSAKK